MESGRYHVRKQQKIRRHIAMLLRDQPAGTTADLLDYTVAYLDGNQLTGLYLSADVPGQLDENFERSEEFDEKNAEAIQEWRKRPRLSDQRSFCF
jgi:hypothetical protein